MYYFIVNPHASGGKGMRVWRQVQRRLPKFSGTQRYEVFLTEKTGDARAFSRKITERCREEKTLVVIGGDGTLSEVVDGACLDSDRVSIAFVPTGYANDFARNLRRKYRLRRQPERFFTAERERMLDYGVLDAENGNRRFVVSAGIGFDAAVFHELLASRCRQCGEYPLRLHSARFSYFLTFLRELKRAQRTRGYILLDQEQRVEFNNIIFISAHVHPHESGYLLGSGANCEDGRLDLCIVSTKRKLRIVRILLAALFGIHKKMSGVHCYRCREAEIHTAEAFPVHTDGESCGKLRDLVLSCVPRKLRVRL